MKKLLFLLCLLLAGAQTWAQTLNVSGDVTLVNNGNPVEGQFVFAYDSLSGIFGQAITDANGHYNMELPANGPVASVLVGISDPCNQVYQQDVPVISNPATGGMFAIADFAIQSCTPPGCWVWADFTHNGDLSYTFNAYTSGLDSTSTSVYTTTWDFGDGTTATGDQVSHTYTQEGSYVVTVTSTSADCSATSTLHILVYDVQPIQISGMITDGNGNPVENQYVFAYDSLNQYWGSAITNANGYYLILMDVANNVSSIVVSTFDACNNEYAQNVTPAPILGTTLIGATANFEFTNCVPQSCWVWADFQIGADLNVTFNGYSWGLDSLSNFTINWDFGDGTTGTGTQVDHTYSQAGTYNVVVTATSADCSATITLPIEVFVAQTVVVSGTVTGSNGAGVAGWDVYIGSTNTIQYALTDANGAYSTTVLVPASANFLTISTYDFCNPAGQTSIEAIIINGAATANFTLCDSFPTPESCGAYLTYYHTAPNTFLFESYSFSNSNSPITSYHWDFGDGTSSTEATPTHTFATEGVYTILLTIGRADGCEAHACDIVFAFGDSTYCPIDTFYYGCQPMFWLSYYPDSNAVSNPLTMTFEGMSFGVVTSWSWDFGDNSTSTDGPVVTHTYNAPGLYNVTLSIVTLDGCESSISMQIYAGDYPWIEQDCQALFIPMPDSTGNGFFFLDLSYSPNAIQSWEWSFGDGTSSTEQNPYHEYSQPGVYPVTLTIQADSCASVITFEVDTDNPFNRFEGNGTLGLSSAISKTAEVATFTALSTYPNPVTDRLVVAFDSRSQQTACLSLVNSVGQMVRTQVTEAQTGKNALQIPVADLAEGMYFLQIRMGQSVETIKVIKAEQ